MSATARVRFVLVQPQSAGNVGSAARALKNLGFRELVVVRPECDPRERMARMMAVDAVDLIDDLVVHSSLDEALGGARTVIGTSRRTGKHRRPHFTLDRFAPEMAGLAGRGSLAVVFGREDHGLKDAELDRCTHLVQLHSSEEYPSYNLSQAVLLVAYELRLALVGSTSDEPEEPPAEHGPREAMFGHLEQALVAIGYLHEASVEPIMRRFRRLLGRSSMTSNEVALLRGLARQILWTAARAGLVDAPEKER